MANKKQEFPRTTVTPDLETMAAQLEALAEVVASGSATIVAAPPKKTAADLPVFEHNGIAYRFRVHGFSLDGTEVYHSSEVVQDEALIEKIVTEYPGLIARSE